MWDHLIQQTIITLNLLRQSKNHPHFSAWAHCNGPFNYNATPSGPAGCSVLIHEPVQKRRSWGFNAIEGFCAGPAIHHCRNYTVFPSKTRAIRISDTVEFRHDRIIVPEITPEDRVIGAITRLKAELGAITSPSRNDQLHVIENTRDVFTKYRRREPKNVHQNVVDNVNESNNDSSTIDNPITQPNQKEKLRAELLPLPKGETTHDQLNSNNSKIYLFTKSLELQ